MPYLLKLMKRLKREPAGFAAGSLAMVALFTYWPNPNMRPALFDRNEVSQIRAFWGKPGRYIVGMADPRLPAGRYQVHETVEGSKWLWNYARALHISVPPTQAAQAPASHQDWTTWLNARMMFDSAKAMSEANRRNAPADGEGDPQVVDLPADPGACPKALVDAVGPPPNFAECVLPTTYTVNFDDFTVTYSDHVALPFNYAYYRFPNGIDNAGLALRTLPPSKLSALFARAEVSSQAMKVMRAVSALEGGFEAVNTYDTGFVSVGFIQFASLKDGAGSLGGMMKGYKARDRKNFDSDFRRFGVDVTDDGHLDVLDPDTGDELTGPEANTKIINDKRLIAVFSRAGTKSESFQAAQIAAAKAQFWPGEDTVSITVAGQPLSLKVLDIVKSEAGIATLMDRKVNRGSLGPFQTIVQQVADTHLVKSVADLCACEREIVTKMRYRKDYLADLTLEQPMVAPPLKPTGVLNPPAETDGSNPPPKPPNPTAGGSIVGPSIPASSGMTIP